MIACRQNGLNPIIVANELTALQENCGAVLDRSTTTRPAIGNTALIFGYRLYTLCLSLNTHNIW
jgi:hypothetical protein